MQIVCAKEKSIVAALKDTLAESSVPSNTKVPLFEELNAGLPERDAFVLLGLKSVQVVPEPG
jgi:hypothetical protein